MDNASELNKKNWCVCVCACVHVCVCNANFPLLHNYLSITRVIYMYIQVSEEEDPAGHATEDPFPSTVTDKMSGDGPPPQITDQISAVSQILLLVLVVHVNVRIPKFV